MDKNEKYKIKLDKSYKGSNIEFDFRTISLNQTEKDIIGDDRINIIIMRYLDRLDEKREFILGKFSDEKLREVDIRDTLNAMTNSFRPGKDADMSDAEMKDRVNNAIDILKYDLNKKFELLYTKEGYEFLNSSREDRMYKNNASVIINKDRRVKSNLSFYGDTSRVFAKEVDREHELRQKERLEGSNQNELKNTLKLEVKSAKLAIKDKKREEKISQRVLNRENASSFYKEIYDTIPAEKKPYYKRILEAYNEKGISDMLKNVRRNILLDVTRKHTEEYLSDVVVDFDGNKDGVGNDEPQGNSQPSY